MIYVLAIFLPPVALLMNRQPLTAIINLIMIVPVVYYGLTAFGALFIIPGMHALIAIAFNRRKRQVDNEFEAARRKISPAVFRRYLERRRARKARQQTGSPTS